MVIRERRMKAKKCSKCGKSFIPGHVEQYVCEKCNLKGKTYKKITF